MTSTTWPQAISLDCGTVRAIDLALFAASSGDHNPLHLDVEAARRAGFDRPVVHGMLTLAYAGRLMTGTFGIGRVRDLQLRFTGVAFLGDTLSLHADLQQGGVESATYGIEVRGPDERAVASGSARIAAPGA